jgi:Sulfatase
MLLVVPKMSLVFLLVWILCLMYANEGDANSIRSKNATTILDQSKTFITNNSESSSQAKNGRQSTPTPTPTQTPPNIVVFLVDDMGWNQVGYHAKPSGNNEIKTPHIDHYATKVGIELDRGYMTPWCGPSRAAIITGRTNVYNFNVSSLISTFDDNIGYVAGLQPGTRTLATALKAYGESINVSYTTWFNGKFGIGVRCRRWYQTTKHLLT